MPHLRELVKLHEKAPFALLGINCGDSKESEYLNGLEEFKVTWLSAWQKGTPVIEKIYGVRGYPTMVLIDHEGKLISNELRGQALEDAIEKAIAKAKAAK